MSNLKDLANRARNRLLNRGLRETVAKAGAISVNNMNFFNDNKNKKESENVQSPFKYLLNEDKLMDISPEAKERYLLDTIRKYLEDKNRLNKDVL